MLPKVAIIGRPNVGKSTLFNRLTGNYYKDHKGAIVDDEFGVTRDLKILVAKLKDICFELIDTAGIEAKIQKGNDITKQMQDFARQTIMDSDIIIFIYDAKVGVIQGDLDVIKMLRRVSDKQIFIIANKCDLPNVDPDEGASLGMGEVIAFSALQGHGLDKLYTKMKPFCPQITENESETNVIKMALVGRPNVGKSTLLNAILGYERVIVSDQAGTTRDSIEVDWSVGDQQFRLIDTAGIRKRAQIKANLEHYSVLRSHIEIDYANICLLVVDATQALERQDINIAKYVIEQGRILMIVINKWDLIATGERKEYLKDVTETLTESLSQVKGVVFCPVSALNKKNISEVFLRSIELYNKWQTRITTGKLNNWLERASNRFALQGSKSGKGSIKYVTQIKTGPPTFVFFCGRVTVPENYRRYLVKSLCTDFELDGVPIRLKFRMKEKQ